MILYRSGFNWPFSLLPYGDAWRARRRKFHQYFNEKAVQGYQQLQYMQVLKYLRSLRTHPEDFFETTRR